MKTYLQPIQELFRRTGLLAPVEQARFLGKMLHNRQRNQRFIRAHPDFALPPADLAFDAYGSPDWAFYHQSGVQTARRIAGLIRRHLPMSAPAQPLRIFEWGCGPARVIRHLPAELGPTAQLFGTDYNPRTVVWCAANIPNITFARNELLPPLGFADNSFDAIYCVSVFTHLAEASGQSWLVELSRVCRPGGLIIFTTNGNMLRPMMLGHERERYDGYGFFERGRYEEGKKMFLAFHNPSYVRQRLIGSLVEQEHIPGPAVGQQDTWVVRKPGA